MRLKIIKVISRIVLIIILLWFFIPEMHLLWISTLDLFSSKCFFATNCRVVNITTLPQPEVDFNSIIEGKSYVFKYEVNLPLDQIDLERSKLEAWKSNYSVVSLLVERSNYSERYEKNFASSNFKLSTDNGNTIIEFTTDPATTKYIEDIYYIHVVDKAGKTHSYFSFGYNYPLYTLLISRYSYLFQYLIWYFAIFGTALFKAPYSLVYDSKSKNPLAGVIVRIFKDGILHQTVVTGTNGILDVALEVGKYRIEAFKPDYIFPSMLYPLSEDGEYKNLYYGQDYVVSKKSRRLLINIPIDPKTNLESNFITKAGMVIIDAFDNVNEYFILLLIVSQVITWPTDLDSYLSLVVGLLLIAFRLVLRKLTETKLGVVLDENKEKIPRLRLYLYDAQWDLLVATEDTDSHGAYQFSVPSNNYYIKINSNKYLLVDENDAPIEKLDLKMDPVKKFMFINDRIRVKTRLP